MARATVDPGESVPKTTSFGIVARNAATAIVLRRGPTRHTRLLRWDLRDDTVHAGQWLIGTVEHGACGLSPSGELFVYSARKGPRRFTAVSRPPYFTALAFWEERLPWTGGGFFAGDDHVVLGVTHPPDEGSLPRGLTVSEVWSYFPWTGNGRSRDTFGDAISKAPEARQGWSPAGDGRRVQRANPRWRVSTLERDAPPGRAGAYRVVRATPRGTAPEVHDLGLLDWADWGHDGSLLFGRQGCLYRQRTKERFADWSPPSLVVDLTGDRFERIVAPKHAREWPRYRK